MNGCPMTSAYEPSVPLSGALSSVETFLDCPTGTVEHHFSDGVFRWSDELYRIHGYERGEVVPTLELGMSHIIPSERAAAEAFWAQVTTTGGPASIYTAIHSLTGQTRKLLISADLILDDGRPVGVWALVVDLTRSMHIDRHQLASEAVAASALNRAVIEQAKGILMARAGLTASEAFTRISSHSQATNRKAVVICQEIIDRTYQLTGQVSEEALARLMPAPPAAGPAAGPA